MRTRVNISPEMIDEQIRTGRFSSFVCMFGVHDDMSLVDYGYDANDRCFYLEYESEGYASETIVPIMYRYEAYPV
jgi:hypothetical protein